PCATPRPSWITSALSDRAVRRLPEEREPPSHRARFSHLRLAIGAGTFDNLPVIRPSFFVTAGDPGSANPPGNGPQEERPARGKARPLDRKGLADEVRARVGRAVGGPARGRRRRRPGLLRRHPLRTAGPAGAGPGRRGHGRRWVRARRPPPSPPPRVR